MSECGPHCEETLREVERYLDGELDPRQAELIAHHLSDCNPCMGRADFRRHLKELVHDRCAERDAPAALVARISALLHETATDP